jgi:hypothetical protein
MIMTQSDNDHIWYMRPVFFVTDIGRAIEYYVGGLGFEKKWHEADGKGTVCQVIVEGVRLFYAKIKRALLGVGFFSSCLAQGSIS